jgi:hypothetical protein
MFWQALQLTFTLKMAAVMFAETLILEISMWRVLESQSHTLTVKVMSFSVCFWNCMKCMN